MEPVDLRSDTLTQPTPAMREAMHTAELGDDVFGEDPTVNALEGRCAELAGKDAAVFVPSGTMANVIACRVHTQPGDELIVERTSHLYRYEGGGHAAIAGISAATLEGTRGLLHPDQIAEAVRYEDVHQPVTSLIWLEDTHNFGGGSCYPLETLHVIGELARSRGLAVHIDGARVMNACVAQGLALSEIAEHADTINFCFSKGLGCPVGSIFVGSEEHARKARRVRKMLGGGMRQAGVLAAAAFYALDNNITRLADDHANAQFIAEGLDGAGGVQVLGRPVETNIVYLDTSASSKDAPAWARALGENGVLCLPLDPQTLRMVTHLGVSRDQVKHATKIAQELFVS